MKITTTITVLLVLSVPAGGALAGPAPADMPAPAHPYMALPERAAPHATPGAAPRRVLEDARGGDSRVTNQATLNGTVANNRAVNVSTGSNTIDTGSFANASGLPMVIQNSGANVLIQNATVINVQFK